MNTSLYTPIPAEVISFLSVWEAYPTAAQKTACLEEERDEAAERKETEAYWQDGGRD